MASSFILPISSPLVPPNGRIELKKKNLTTVSMATDYDRVKFDESKLGVKGFVDAGTTVIPSFFIHPPENLSDLNSMSPKDIPIIDLSGIESDRRTDIVEQIRQASNSWGFFQITNHGIPIDVMDDTINAVKSFNEQPAAAKAEYYTRDPAVGFNFSSNVDLFKSTAASWRDTIQVRLGLNPVDPDRIPAICRKQIVEWDERVKGLAETLSELLAEGLGVGPKRFVQMTCLENRLLAGHYYPYCPQAELTIGLMPHADPGFLTVVLQDQVGGLQVRYGDEWVPVKPLHGALVINIGDLLQIMSNDEYKSAKHRVLANSLRDPRTSIAIFCNPGKRGDSDLYGPLPELLSPEKPPLYCNFTMKEYMNSFFNKKGLDGRTPSSYFRK